jgi:hypothetical protein
MRWDKSVIDRKSIYNNKLEIEIIKYLIWD